MKNKKHYVGRIRFIFYGFVGILIIPILIAIIGFINNQNELKQWIILPLLFIPFLLILATLGFNWIEVDEIGIHAKTIWRHIETIRWKNIEKIEAKLISYARFAQEAIIVYSYNCETKKIKSYYNKGDGMIKANQSKEVKGAIEKYCPNKNFLNNL